MQIIDFGKTGESVSRLGLGCMRLPVIDGREDRIDEERAVALIRHAIDGGISYIDTAYPYHGGHAERVVGKALEDGYRKRVKLATKMPPWMIKEPGDLERIFSEQLEALQTETIDFYLVHALTGKRWAMAKEKEVLPFLIQKKKEGIIKHLGFSFHGDYPLFEEILEAYPWDFCQIQYNFMDREVQAGEKGLKLAHAKGLAVVIMEPLRGGSLVNDLAPDIEGQWKEANPSWSPASWGLRFLFDRKEVSVVLSGMTRPEQIDENIRTASTAPVGHLKESERDTIERVRKIYQERISVPCTACQYCMPCPHGVDIPGTFTQVNNAKMFDDVPAARFHYHILLTKHDKQASQCIRCGACEPKCPQHIAIMDELERAVDCLEK